MSPSFFWVPLSRCDLGEGPPLLMLAGGPGMDAGYMLPLADHFSRHHRVILLDQRGTGASGRPPLAPENYNLELYVEDIEAVRGALGVERWTVVGHSWGGLLAMAYACRRPEDIEGLVLVGTCGPTIEFLEPALECLRARSTPEDDADMQALRDSGLFESDPDAAASEASRISMPWFFKDRKLGERYRDTQSGNITTSGIFRTVFDELRETGLDLREALGKVTAPATVIHGDYDHIPVEFARQAAEAMPNVVFHVIENCGHFPWVEKPEALYELLIFDC